LNRNKNQIKNFNTFLRVSLFHGAKAWVADFKHEHYQAAKNAMVKGLFKKIV
jgi:hypothetical protein